MLEPHEFCLIFPDMSPEDYAYLKADIAKNGQREKIVTFEGKILDGRNRYRACTELGKDAVTSEYSGNDALAFATSKNMARRHLTQSQRAAIAVSLVKHYEVEASVRQAAVLKKGDEPCQIVPLVQICTNGRSNEKAAKESHVSTRQVAHAIAVEKANPAKFEEVRAGKKTLNKAVREIKNEAAAPKSEPEPEPEKLEDDEKLNAAFIAHKPVRDVRTLLTNAITTLRAIPDEARGPFLSIQSVESHLGRAKHEILASAPYAVCPYCEGDGGCRTCHDLGYVPRTQYDNAPRELKAGKAVRK